MSVETPEKESVTPDIPSLMFDRVQKIMDLNMVIGQSAVASLSPEETYAELQKQAALAEAGI